MSTSSQRDPFLIVGAGIGGLSVALALARAGVRSRVIEQAPAFKEVGAGIQFGPNGFKMLTHLGLDAAVDHLAVYPDELVMMDGVTGQPVTRIPLGQAFRDRFHHPYALIHRADLHGVLLDACRRDPLVELCSNQAVDTIVDQGDVVQAVTMQDEVHTGAGLIGADGLWSRVRGTIIGDGAPRVSGHIAYRAVLPIGEVPARFRQNAMILWAGPKSHLVQYPLRGGKLFNLVAVFHSDAYDEGWNTKGNADELFRRFEGTCETVQTLLRKVESWRMWVLCDREPIQTWSRGRVTLLGDAAHPMLQYLAQGACMAMEDGVVLADSLAAAEGNVVKAFEVYQKARYLRTGRAQLTARLYGAVYHAEGVSREIRNEMLGKRTPEQAYDGLAWLYDGV